MDSYDRCKVPETPGVTIRKHGRAVNNVYGYIKDGFLPRGSGNVVAGGKPSDLPQIAVGGVTSDAPQTYNDPFVPKIPDLVHQSVEMP
jgi:hypothetical protein